MKDSIMYEEDYYVVLESDREEQFFNALELQAKLQQLLKSQPQLIPRELQTIPSPSEQARQLMNNYYELDIGDGGFLQWYAVRLEK